MFLFMKNNKSIQNETFGFGSMESLMYAVHVLSLLTFRIQAPEKETIITQTA